MTEFPNVPKAKTCTQPRAEKNIKTMLLINRDDDRFDTKQAYEIFDLSSEIRKKQGF